MINKKTILLSIIPLIFLSGCDDRFRYPCQDPDNWDKQECKKPWCSADGTCPEDLTHYEKKTGGQPQPQVQQQMPSKGECK
jgi:hypothetical protein